MKNKNVQEQQTKDWHENGAQINEFFGLLKTMVENKNADSALAYDPEPVEFVLTNLTITPENVATLDDSLKGKEPLLLSMMNGKVVAQYNEKIQNVLDKKPVESDFHDIFNFERELAKYESNKEEIEKLFLDWKNALARARAELKAAAEKQSAQYSFQFNEQLRWVDPKSGKTFSPDNTSELGAYLSTLDDPDFDTFRKAVLAHIDELLAKIDALNPAKVKGLTHERAIEESGKYEQKRGEIEKWRAETQNVIERVKQDKENSRNAAYHYDSVVASLYEWVDFEWKITIDGGTYVIRPENVNDYYNLEIADKLDATSLHALQKDGNSQYVYYRDLIESRRPLEKDYQSDLQYRVAQARWEQNKRENREFWVKLAEWTKGDALKIKGKDVGYSWVSAMYGAYFAGQRCFYSDAQSNQEIYSDLVQRASDFLTQLNAALPTVHNDSKDIVSKQKPNATATLKEREFFGKLQDDNIKELDGFYNRLIWLVDAAISVREANVGKGGADGNDTAENSRTYKPVEIVWRISEGGIHTAFSPSTGVDYTLFVGLQPETLANLIRHSEAEYERLKDEINWREPSKGYFKDDYEQYERQLVAWQKNDSDNTTFWQTTVKAAFDRASQVEAAKEAQYAWINPRFETSDGIVALNDCGQSFEDVFRFYDSTALKIVRREVAASRRKQLKDVDSQTLTGSDAKSASAFDQYKSANKEQLSEFYDSLDSAIEKLSMIRTSDESAKHAPATHGYQRVVPHVIYEEKGKKLSYKEGDYVDYKELALFSHEFLEQHYWDWHTKLRDAFDAYIQTKEPKKSEYSNQEEYDKAIQEWQENLEQNRFFWTICTHTVGTALHYQDAESVGYKWVEVEFQTAYQGTAIYISEANIHGVIADIPKWDAIKRAIVLARAEKARDGMRAAINAQKDDASNLSESAKRNFKFAKQENLSLVNGFFSLLFPALSKELPLAPNYDAVPSSKEDIEAAADYQWVDVQWTINYTGDDGQRTLVLTPENISYSVLNEIPLDELRAFSIKDEKARLQTALSACKPKKKDYKTLSAQKAALAQWEVNSQVNKEFWIKADAAVKTAISKARGESFGYQWVDILFKIDVINIAPKTPDGTLTRTTKPYLFHDNQSITPEHFAGESKEGLEEIVNYALMQKDSLEQQIDATNPMPQFQGTGAAAKRTVFALAKKANRDRLNAFYNDSLIKALESAIKLVEPPKSRGAIYGYSYVSAPPTSTASFRQITTTRELRILWTEMTLHYLKETETTLFDTAKAAWFQYMEANAPQNDATGTAEWNKLKETGTTFWNDASSLLDSLIESKEALLKQPPDNSGGFPDSIGTIPSDIGAHIKKGDRIGNLTVVSAPGSETGGSTGTMVVADDAGNKYILKRGAIQQQDSEARAAHIRNECAADSFYRTLGARVPEYKLYEDENGNPIKLSRFIDGKLASIDKWWSSASQEDKELMRAKIREHFAIDVLLGNWDAIGDFDKNILIDENGNPWKIDNGCSLGFRGQGNEKGRELWGEVDSQTGEVHAFVDDLWTMTGTRGDDGDMHSNRSRINSAAPSCRSLMEYFGEYDVLQIANQIEAYRDMPEMKKALVALGKVSPDDRKIVEKRLEEVRQIAKRGANFFDEGTYTREFTLDVLDASYAYSKEGLREACHFECDPESQEYGWFRESSTPARFLGNNGAAPELARRYNSLTAYLRDKVDEPAMRFYRRCIESQEQGSWTSGSKSNGYSACWAKLLQLRAQGINVFDYADADEFYDAMQKTGYYIGNRVPLNTADEKTHHWTNMRDAYNYFKGHRQEYDKRYAEMTKIRAGLQIALENADFAGNNRTKGTITLARTESDSVVTTHTRGEKSEHKRGPNESHGLLTTTVVNGNQCTMVEIPHSRVTAIYLMEGDPGVSIFNHYNGQENEINADTSGFPAWYMGEVTAGEKIADFMYDFEQYKKENP